MPKERTLRQSALRAQSTIMPNITARNQKIQEEIQNRAEATEGLLEFPSKWVGPTPVENSLMDPKALQRLYRYLNERINTKSSATAIAVKMFGPEAVLRFLQERDAVRYIYAPADNNSQCIRAGLKNPNDPTQVASMKCWLCGFSLKKSNGSSYDTIACEHILPVYQAVMFADISLAKAPSTSTPELMRAEYEWAHSVCNGPKSDSVFIKEIRDTVGNLKGWEADITEIETILRKTLPNIINKGIDEGTLRTPEAKKVWITKQTNAIVERLKPIISAINLPSPDSARMMALWSAAKLGDPERWASKVELNRAAYDRYVDGLLEREIEKERAQQTGSRRRRQTKRKRRQIHKRK